MLWFEPYCEEMQTLKSDELCCPWRPQCLLLFPNPWEWHQWTGLWLLSEMMKLNKHAKNAFLSWVVCNQHFSEDSLHFHQFLDVEPGWITPVFVSVVGSGSYRTAECDSPSLQWRSVWTHHTCDWQTGLLCAPFTKVTPVLKHLNLIRLELFGPCSSQYAPETQSALALCVPVCWDEKLWVSGCAFSLPHSAPAGCW